jgi:manganese/zinc/iron transport system permease protein
MNPYSGASWFSFFGTFFGRLFAIAEALWTGGPLATDEVQVLVLGALGICCGLLGSLLVLRRMTMLANSLSHTILLGIVAAFLLARYGIQGEVLEQGPLPVWALMLASGITAVLTTFLTDALTRWFRLSEEASTGLVFTALFAAAIVAVTLFTRNAHIGIEIVMGNADGLSRGDVTLAGWVLGCNAIAVLFLFRSYLATTFDAGFSSLIGFRPALISYVLMAQVGLSVVAGFRAVGVLMVLAFLVGPPLAARGWVRSLRGLMLASSVLGGGAGLLAVATARGLLTAFRLPLSTGALAVFWVSLFVAGSFALQAIQRRRTDPVVPAQQGAGQA